MNIQIDKNIPIPQMTGMLSGEQKYPWNKLEIGDSFFLPPGEGEDGNLTRIRNRVMSAGREYAKKHPGWDFVALKVEEERENPDFDADDEENETNPRMIKVVGVRVWRRPDKEVSAE